MEFPIFDYRPNLDELDFHYKRFNYLKNLTIYDMPNLLFYGPPTSGKSTVIYAFIASLMDKRVYDIKTNSIEEDKKIIYYRSSIYHIEFNCYEIATHDKTFIQCFLKSYIQTKNIGLDIPKIVYIKNANLLSKQSQLSFRRMIEMYSLTCRFIFEIQSYSSIYESLTSRCLTFRVPLPSTESILNYLMNHNKSNNVDVDNMDNHTKEINYIITTYPQDLKKIFGTYYYYINSKERFIFYYYEQLDEIYNIIEFQKMSNSNVDKIREIIYELYILLVPVHECIMYLFNKICNEHTFNKKNDFIFQKIMDIVIQTNNGLKKGNKDFFHFEYFIIGVYNVLNPLHN